MDRQMKIALEEMQNKIDEVDNGWKEICRFLKNLEFIESEKIDFDFEILDTSSRFVSLNQITYNMNLIKEQCLTITESKNLLALISAKEINDLLQYIKVIHSAVQQMQNDLSDFFSETAEYKIDVIEDNIIRITNQKRNSTFDLLRTNSSSSLIRYVGGALQKIANMIAILDLETRPQDVLQQSKESIEEILSILEKAKQTEKDVKNFKQRAEKDVEGITKQTNDKVNVFRENTETEVTNWKQQLKKRIDGLEKAVAKGGRTNLTKNIIDKAEQDEVNLEQAEATYKKSLYFLFGAAIVILFFALLGGFGSSESAAGIISIMFTKLLLITPFFLFVKFTSDNLKGCKKSKESYEHKKILLQSMEAFRTEAKEMGDLVTIAAYHEVITPPNESSKERQDSNVSKIIADIAKKQVEDKLAQLKAEQPSQPDKG